MSWSLLKGGLAQLARAPALQAGGQRFESVILHVKAKYRNYKSYKTYKTYKSNTELKRKKSTLTYWKRVRSRASGGRQTRANQKSQRREAKRRCKAESDAERRHTRRDSKFKTEAKRLRRAQVRKSINVKGKERRAHEGCLGSRRRRRT